MSAPHDDVTTASTRPTSVQTATRWTGVVFLLVGVLGFVPGVTTGYGTLAFASHHSGARLLGVFQVSVLHNLVHLLFGVAGLALARRVASARGYLVVGGLVYLLLFVYGLLVPDDSPANVVPLNAADDLLHLLLAIVMIGLGVSLTRRAFGARRADV